MHLPARALLVRAPWCDLIVDKVKTLEVRGSSTSQVGRRIGIAWRGMLLGEATVTGVARIDTVQQLNDLRPQTGLPDLHQLPYAKTFTWTMDTAVRYPNPIPYVHPRGAQIWVVLK